MKLSKVIALICLSIETLVSQRVFGTEVGNYWIVENNSGVRVGYSLQDWRGYLNGVLRPGLTDGTRPPLLYSSFPHGDVEFCDFKSPTTNVFKVYSPLSKTPICDFQIMAKVTYLFGPRLCPDSPMIIEPKSYVAGVICKHTQRIQQAQDTRGTTRLGGDTVYSEISIDCRDRNNCLPSE
jgi:hypothetical protein